MADRHSGETGKGTSRYGPTGGRGKRSTLASADLCPFLGSLDRDTPYNYVSRSHICTAQKRQEWRGFRRVSVAHTAVTRQKQSDHCLAAFRECAHYRKAAGASPAEAAEVGKPKPRAAARARGKPRRRPAAARDPFRNSQWDSAILLGKIGAITLVLAFVVSFLFSDTPRRWYESLLFMAVRTQAGSLGLDEKQLDKAKKAGLLKGGTLKALKNLSPAQKAKLRGSLGAKKLTSSQKARLKKLMKKR